MRQTDIRRAADHARTVITTIRTNGPREVNDSIARDTAAAQTRVAMRAQDVLVINPALALRTNELFLDIVAQVFFFE